VTSHSERERDYAYMEWVKTQPCLLRGKIDEAGRCSGGWCEADHAGERAGWRRAADRTCIPLCARHHADRHHRRYYFAGWSWEQMRSWCDQSIITMLSHWDSWQRALF
jgi:hypothetical protein